MGFNIMRKTTQFVTYEVAREIQSYLEDWNHHTDSMLIDCYMLCNAEHSQCPGEIIQNIGDMAVQAMKYIDELHEQIGHMTPELSFMRNTLYNRVVSRIQDLDRVDRVEVPNHLVEAYETKAYDFIA